MKKTFVALLVVMLTAPAWANVAITVVDLGDGKAGIDYSGTELARAFALDITVDAGVIEAISDLSLETITTATASSWATSAEVLSSIP